jgi:hypothetical protein
MAQVSDLRGNQRMADAVLRVQGTTLIDFLTEFNHAGYEEIAKQLHSKTDGVVSISHATVKRWCEALGIERAAS